MTTESSNRILYGYFRSSASYRVRIALNLKGLRYDYAAIHLLRNGGEQFQPRFTTLNPLALVPVLRDQDLTLSQSLTIIEYLEETYPQVPLLPYARGDRAHVRQLAQTIACEIHPLNNLRVLNYLTAQLGLSAEQKQQWIAHWIETGFSALEQQLGGSPRRGRFCFGDTPTLADCCLIPQLFNARRFNLDLSAFPTLLAIAQACDGIAAFRDAAPDAQPDRE